MKATGKLLTFALPLFIVALLGGPQQTHARYAEQALKSDQTEFGNQLEGQDPAMEIRERQDVPESPHNPTLFELLMSALQKGEAKNENKRGKQSKPCYWSLVSCY